MEQINESAVLNGQLTRWKINYPILVLHLEIRQMNTWRRVSRPSAAR